MKTTIRGALFSLFLIVTAGAYAVPSLEVTVLDSQTRMGFKCATKTDGTFTTGKLAPGSYVVQFKSRNAAVKKDRYLLIVCAGKKTVISNAFSGDSFSGGGVAVRMDVDAGKSITGQVASATELEQAKVKVVNGKRYYWTPSDLGTNLGGRWVEASSASTLNVVGWNLLEIRRLQDHAGEASMGGNEIGHK